MRELSDATISDQAEQLDAYIRKPGSQGAVAWLDAKGFAPADRAAVLLALSDLDDGLEVVA